jgi:protein TonB
MRAVLHEPLIPTLALAAAVHALIIWGVDFRAPEPAPARARPLDVTLAVNPASEDPERAERLAERAQEASGSGGEAPTPPPLTLPPPPPQAPEPRGPQPDSAPEFAFLTTLDAPHTLPRAAQSGPAPRIETRVQDPVLRAEIARLSAEIARHERSYLAHPRTRYLHTLSAKAADEAEYVRRWVERVEEIGNLHYPDEARRRGLSGTLIVHVLVDQSGRLLEARVGVRSGHQVLDDAALRIVHLAAPFEPFPESMRERYSRLMITRTWEFRSGQRLRMR